MPNPNVHTVGGPVATQLRVADGSVRSGGERLRVEPDESVAAVYARDIDTMPDALFVRIGSLHIVGRPAVLVEVLDRVLSECWSVWADGRENVACDGPDVAGAGTSQVMALPPSTAQTVVGDALSRIGPGPTAKPLVLDGVTASTDDPQVQGGGIRKSFYLIRHEVERDG